MLLALLLLVAVPLWLVALEMTTLVVRNRALRKAAGAVPVRFRAPGKSRWHAGHAMWVHDVFVFRGSPAAWKEALLWAAGVSSRPATPTEKKKLRGVDLEPVVLTIALQPRGSVRVAVRPQDAAALMLPFARSTPTPAQHAAIVG